VFQALLISNGIAAVSTLTDHLVYYLR
jgi:hypothetical protein